MKRLLLLAACSLAASMALAQTLYKLVDKNGKVTYSESAPRPGEFDGTVTRIEIDANACSLRFEYLGEEPAGLVDYKRPW